MIKRTCTEYGIIDAAGQSFVISGYHKDDMDPPHFILPREVIERANVIYNIGDEKLVKCRWARTDSEDALHIIRGIFRALTTSTEQLKREFDGTNYGSRTHRSI